MSGRSPARGLRLAAPAKLNLYLRVLGRRDDGYHLIDSVVAFAAESDVLTARPARTITLRIDGPFAGALEGTGNLVRRAADALADAAAVGDGASLTLTKNLPVAAGIGGGSADAAAALRLLARLWRLDPDAAALAPIALSLGADVPACLDGGLGGGLGGGTVRVGGIGELLEPVPALPPIEIVLVNPGRPVETAAVFRARGGAFSAPAPAFARFEDAASVARWLGALGNDLSEAARRIEPSIKVVLAALEAEGCLLARLSGSGATCFALFETTDEAASAASHLSQAHPQWWVRASRLRAAPPEIEEIGPKPEGS